MKVKQLLNSLLVSGLTLSIVCAGCTSQAERTEKPASRAASQDPPAGLQPNQVPMFVSIGFDDNEYVEGLEWINQVAAGIKNPAGRGNSATYDGSAVTFSFYCSAHFSKKSGQAWKELQENGHEIGNHSLTHPHGSQIDWARDPASFEILLSEKQWQQEISSARREFKKSGINTAKVTGFRQPFLEYTENSLNNLGSNGLTYDCSIQEGYQAGQDGTDFFWPYTLDQGSPGDVTMTGWVEGQKPLKGYPGLWELPVYVLILPPDELCRSYGIAPGFRERMNQKKDYLESSEWKITGFDYNLWFTDDGTEEMMTPAEFLGTLKYNFDLRLKGNRAPMMLGAHIEYYNLEERRQVITDFIAYALSHPDVRIVSNEKILAWLNNPAAL